MDINWKEISQCSGYKKIKASYIKDLHHRHRSRSKDEYYRVFRRTIDVAINHALKLNVSVKTILNAWEEKRGHQWWYGFYSNKKKIHSESLKPMGMRGIRKYYKASYVHDPKRRKARMLQLICQHQKNESTKKKKRWSPARRKRGW